MKIHSKDQKLQKQQPRAGDNETQQSGQKKKISKAKLRKIKQRYGDQDEEERQMKMQLLASAGKHVEAEQAAKHESKGREDEKMIARKSDSDENSHHEQNFTETDTRERAGQHGDTEDKLNEDQKDMTIQNEPEDVSDDEDVPVTDDLTALLNSLTGVPHEEDVLLYAVAICAPYQTMTNYKYKVINGIEITHSTELLILYFTND